MTVIVGVPVDSLQGCVGPALGPPGVGTLGLVRTTLADMGWCGYGVPRYNRPRV